MTSLTANETMPDADHFLIAKENEGKFAVIKDDLVLGVFYSMEDALRQGKKELGRVVFLPKQTSSNHYVT